MSNYQFYLLVLVVILGVCSSKGKDRKDLESLRLHQQRLENAQRQEKMHQLLADNKAGHNQLFDRANDIINSPMIHKNADDLQRTAAELRNRKRRIRNGIFKFDKKFSTFQILASSFVILLVVVLVLISYALIKKMNQYLDNNLISTITRTTKDLMFVALIFAVFNIISMHNVLVTFQHYVNIEAIGISGVAILLLWLARGVVKIAYA